MPGLSCTLEERVGTQGEGEGMHTCQGQPAASRRHFIPHRMVIAGSVTEQPPAAQPYREGVQQVLVDACALIAWQEVGDRGHDPKRPNHAKHAFPAHDLRASRSLRRWVVNI
jgi:hypothetical protein